MKFDIKILPNGKGLPLPTYATKESAGMDLGAAIEEPITLQPGKRVLIGTGFQISIDYGYEAQIRSRSGLSYKHGLVVMNSPGTIDSDYRGEVKVLLINLGEDPFVIERGMRIAQLVIAPVQQIEWTVKEELDDSDRDAFGFGSTGVKPLAGAA